MTKTICFYGMERSGNHATISWVRNNLPSDNWVFFNNCSRKEFPVDSFSNLELRGELIRNRNAEIFDKSMEKELSDPNAFDHILVSYEYGSTSPIMLDENTIDPDAFKTEFGRFDQTVFIVREFLNWLASTYQRQKNRLESQGKAPAGFEMEPAGKLLLMAINWAKNLEDLKSIQKTGIKNVHVIKYDEWYRSEDYRSSKLVDLGLPEKSNGLPEFSKYGGGSSFKRTDKSKTPEQRKVTERFLDLKDDEIFMSVVKFVLLEKSFKQSLCEFFPQSEDYLEKLGV